MNPIDFEQVVSTFSKRLTAAAYSVTKDWFTAEDVVQESFIKAYKKIDCVESKDKIGAWLYSITIRTAIDFLRAEKRKQYVPADLAYLEYAEYRIDAESSLEETVELSLLKEDLYDSLHGLSKEYRDVLYLKMQFGLKEAEIASRLELKATTVKTRLHRARKQLRQVMDEKYSA